MISSNHVLWQQQHVVDVRDAAFAARTYREHADVRALLRRVTGAERLQSACEVGAGYGRMTVVLTEFAEQVTGLERERHFVEEATRLLPEITFINVAALTQLPVATESLDLVLTFTVLQHLIDPVVQATSQEILRILKPGGHLLICEESDPQLRDGDLEDPAGMCTIGRPVTVYQQLFGACELLATQPRRIEPTYPRADVGTYMLFRKPG
ncbi:class I SAM-dependent methyltransferase [Geitlerinema sp. PCC 7407]|uniref:class I SAM-dependent methyltransferase n=1 Tax=Geitlerinema sp. PCC 7407 TaxID=1173025 RepID=UPI00029F9263|nr:class I SAM-dependent methyltransferase [Geitlerinema sp. PCC 7407]AFY68055.1 Methyltransferase type 11 [Geitlerinema sp. PCC 7407]